MIGRPSPLAAGTLQGLSHRPLARRRVAEALRRMQSGFVNPDVIGWVSSLILVATIARQVHKQWREGSSEGVSKWLFIGQLAASAGFTAYSLLIENWVFVVTNGLMIGNGVAGYLIVRLHRKRERAGDSPGGQP